MRGRVGRSNRQAYCYLLVPNLSNISPEARKRVMTLEEFSDLGEGFKIAMRDLEIRGAGNLLGAEQSGFINDIGLETYQHILKEAVKELKEEEFKGLFENDDASEAFQLLFSTCVIETDLEIIIPETYITNSNERLNLYMDLDKINDEGTLKHFQKNLIDKYGKYPEPVEGIFKILKIRWLAQKLCLEKIVYKRKLLKLYLPSNKSKSYYSSEDFTKILNIINKNSDRSRIQEYKNQMVVSIINVSNIDSVYELLV